MFGLAGAEAETEKLKQSSSKERPFLVNDYLPTVHRIHILLKSIHTNVIDRSVQINTHLFYVSEVNSVKTSTNGHLSATATLFCPGGQSVHLLLFKSVHNGHLTTTATATNACPQLPK